VRGIEVIKHPTTPRPEARPFSILDAMILIAASAIGFFVLRAWVGPALEIRNLAHFTVIMEFLSVLGFCWTVGVMAILLRRPASSRRWRLHQAGLLGCLGVVIASCLNGLYHWAGGYRFRPQGFYDLALNLSPAYVAAAGVAVAWSTLALGGRWRRSRSWYERLGRVMGWYWLALYVIWVGSLFLP
jgi:hypothetical protein